MSTKTDIVLEVDQQLKQLKEQANNCQECELFLNRRQVVWADGDASCEIMLIAEAPGKDEDIAGIPFVGRAGQLLDKILMAPDVKIPRKTIYIANVIKCWPGEGNPTPTEDQMYSCIHFLNDQINLVKPHLIVAMGNPACWALDILPNMSGITKVRGKEYEYNGILTIPTFHTAYILRRGGIDGDEVKRQAWNDWKLISQKWRELRNVRSS